MRQLESPHAPIVFYYMVKDLRKDEDVMRPVIKVGHWAVFPAKGEQVRFEDAIYYVKRVLWDLDVEGEVTVSVGLQTQEESVEDMIKEELERGSGGNGNCGVSVP